MGRAFDRYATLTGAYAAKVPSDEVKHLNYTQDQTLRAER